MIDGGVTMVLVGTAIQAAPATRAFIQQLRRRPATREIPRSTVLLSESDTTLEQLMRSAGAALDARP